MLIRFRLHNFKSFLNTSTSFQPRQLVIGRNNSGKTTLASSLRFLKGLAVTDLAAAASVVPGGMFELCHWGLASDTIEIGCDCELDVLGQPIHYVYDVTLTRQGSSAYRRDVNYELRVTRESLKMTRGTQQNVVLLFNNGEHARLLDEPSLGAASPTYTEASAPRDSTMLAKLYQQPGNELTLAFRDFLSTWLYYSLSPMRMRSGFAEGATNTQVLAVDGSNIAEILFYIKNINESVYRRVIECVRVMEPSLKSINFIAMPNQPLVPFVELSQNPRASWGGLSDGTLRTMGLACIAFQSAMYTDTMSVSPLAIIEEPENGLFPGLLKTVLNWFDDWAPQSQFVFTSHSPFFIDLFDARRRAVTLLSKKDDRTVCATPENTEHTLSEDEHLTLSQEYATELFR